MEEDPSMEWEIVDYSSCLEDEEEKEKSKLDWILNAGLSIGKKLVITGVVISSVPFVLPPLVVISALGVAFSLPFGFVFASYACTEKLMSKLLLPSSPAATSSDQMIDDYEKEEEGIILIDDDIEKEEKEQGEALKDEIEMRNELVDYDGPGGEQKISSLKFTDEAGGYDQELDVEGKDDKIKIEEKPCIFNMTAVDDNAIKTDDATQTNNLIMANEGEKNKNANAEADDETVSDKDKKVNLNIPKEKSSSVRRGKRKKWSGKRKEAEEEKKRHENDKDKEKELLLLLEETTKTSSSENNNLKGKLEAGGEKQQVVDVEEEKYIIDDVSSSEKEHADIVDQKGDLSNNNIQTIIDETIVINDDDLGSSLEKDEETTSQGQSVRNGVVSDEEANMSKTGLPATENAEVNYSKSRTMIADDGENSLKLGLNKQETPELKEEEDACAAYSHSDEEKIWKEMEAIKGIVGFRAPTRPSYFEELKALYLFTGIEPPSSFTDPSDPSEFWSRLRFLKSVIGLK